MVNSVQIIWSLDAEKDLKKVYQFCAKQDIEYANKIIVEIIESPKNVIFDNQYQEDEFLGLPYRRLFIKHWRIVYKVKNNSLTVLRVFDTRQNPKKLK